MTKKDPKSSHTRITWKHKESLEYLNKKSPRKSKGNAFNNAERNRGGQGLTNTANGGGGEAGGKSAHNVTSRRMSERGSVNSNKTRKRGQIVKGGGIKGKQQ